MSKTDTEKARAAKNAYARAWRAKNPDKVKAAAVRYWARRAEREAAQLAADQRKEDHRNERT